MKKAWFKVRFEAECDGKTIGGHHNTLLCAWADHGSFGMAEFVDWDQDEAERVFGQIHQAVLVRD